MESTISALISTNASDNIKLFPFLNLNYWFGNPGNTGLFSLWLLEGLLAVLTLVSVYLLIISTRKRLNPPTRRFSGKVGWYGISFAVLGWVLLLFRILSLPWVSIRFAWVLWLAGLVFTAWRFVNFYTSKLPEEENEFRSLQIKRRYFPGRKKNKRKR